MNLVSHDDPILRAVMPRFTGSPKELRSEAAQMFNFMAAHNGVGVAANQVGKRLRMFVMASIGSKRYADAYVCINPCLQTKVHGPIVERMEGCITQPGVFSNVVRHDWIWAEWTDLRGKLQQRQLFGLLAQCFQHELDHLNGVTIWQDKPKVS